MRFRTRGWYALTAGLLAASTWAPAAPTRAADPGTAELSISPASHSLSVRLVANSTGFPAPVVSYLWKFGDGKSKTTSTPTVVHAYPSTGRFGPEVIESDAAGDQASARGTLELFDCPATQTCTKMLSNANGVKTLKATGPTVAAPVASVDLFVGAYQIMDCDPSVGTDGAITDSGFSDSLTIKLVYLAQNPNTVALTCFSSEVPFVDAQGETVNNGALPTCSATNDEPPCVESITTTQTASGLQATKVLLIPPGDPKVGAL